MDAIISALKKLRAKGLDVKLEIKESEKEMEDEDKATSDPEVKQGDPVAEAMKSGPDFTTLGKKAKEKAMKLKEEKHNVRASNPKDD